MQHNRHLKSRIATIITAIMLLAFCPCRAQKAAVKHVVKYYFGDSVAEHITTRPDTIGINAFMQYPGLDSLETYLGRKLDGFKIVLNDGERWLQQYKLGRFMQEKVYRPNGQCIYASYIDPSTIPKTKLTFTSGRNYFSRSVKMDTLIVENAVVPYVNRAVHISGKYASIGFLDKNSFLIRLEDPAGETKTITIRVQSLYDNAKSKSITETFTFPVQ